MTASREDVEAAFKDPKLANVLYHDWESASYDEKWSISFDERCTTFAVDRFRAVSPGSATYDHALELGCGTGFFLLNLMQGGIARRGTVTDLSPGMVSTALRNASGLGLEVDGRVADAETIPVPDASVDLVVGHAVLHHIPDLDTAFREILRVLRPGGRFVFAGEPTRLGDLYARKLGQATWWATTRWAPSSWLRPQTELDESSRAAALESVVDQHVFDPDRLERFAHAAGAVDVRVVTEELTAAVFGWPVRTFEAAVPTEKLGMGWAMFAYRTWQRLSWLDARLARVVPRALFYNALVTGVKPPEPVQL
ncbi:class I SAM-dependent methyltransferase [Actinomycetospora sp. C-140]